MYKKTQRVLFITGAMILLLTNSSTRAFADPPPITIDLSFDKEIYNYGEPVETTLTVNHNSASDLLISKGFMDTNFMLQIRVNDPANRQVFPAPPEPPPEEFADYVTPYGFTLYNNQIVKVGPCEMLPAGWTDVDQEVDLRQVYNFELPGYYTFEVQVSAMTFKDGVCSVNDHEWNGTLKSVIKTIYIQGATEVEIAPTIWQTGWTAGNDPFPNVTANIYPKDGMNLDEYNLGSIKMNNVPATEIIQRYSSTLQAEYLVARFNKKAVIDTFNSTTVDQWYPVVLSGRMNSGALFGGGEDILLKGQSGNCYDQTGYVDPGVLSVFNLHKAEVEWDKNEIRLEGTLAFDCKDYYTAPPIGGAWITVSSLNETANDSLSFSTFAQGGKKWEYEDSNLSGVETMRIDWTGASFSFVSSGTQVKAKHFGHDSTTIEITGALGSGIQTITIGNLTVLVDEAGQVTLVPESLAGDVDIDTEDNEIEFKLLSALSLDAPVSIARGETVDQTIVADHFNNAEGRFEIKAHFNPGDMDGSVQDKTLKLEISAGEQRSPGVITISESDWDKIKNNEWRYKK